MDILFNKMSSLYNNKIYKIYYIAINKIIKHGFNLHTKFIIYIPHSPLKPTYLLKYPQLKKDRNVLTGAARAQ